MIPPTPPPAIVSQNFADRAVRLTERIGADAERKILSTAQQGLYLGELDSAKSANAKHNRDANAMLDEIERQLAPIDFILSRSSDGRAIAVHVGDDVTVAMNDQYFWDVANSDTSALSLHKGVMFVRGTQGIWRAQKPATVTLKASQRDGTASAAFVVVILPKS
jgi:hypothetical protein